MKTVHLYLDKSIGFLKRKRLKIVIVSKRVDEYGHISRIQYTFFKMQNMTSRRPKL